MARLVFDTGSTLSFVRKGLCEQIGAKLIGHAETSVGRFGDQKGYNAKYPVKQVQLQLRNGSTMQMRLRETNAVSTPIRLVPVDRSEFPCEITTSDWAEMLVTETTAAEIDILVGLDYYYDIVGPEQWRGTSGLVVKQTAVGKIVTGFLKDTDSRQEQNQLLVVEQARETSHLFDIERFWRLEDIGVKDSPGLKDDEVALEQFKSTVRVTNMRYEVQWPFKTEKPELPTNYSVALRRLNSVYKKLDKDHSLADKYNSIFVEQLDKGIIEEAPEEPDGVVHYLPHHAVITPGKETTKVRVVFDASSKEKADALSLNDAMHRGPVFLNNMVGMQLRFRLSKVAITSDVEKAFLQISLQRHHRDCTRFLWLKDHAKPPTPTNIVVYRYARVAFGMKASPFLLAATIIHHMLIVGTPTALEVKDNTYMDNSFGGRDNTADAKQYYAEAKQLFRQISMNLREWYSNDKEFISSLPVADQGKSSCPSVLGLRWNTDRDTVHCPTAAVPTEAQHATKRQILKDLASAFDPCGWFSGITVRAKMIMQELWREKTGWDEKVGQEVLARWQTIQRDLAEISQVELPRQLERPHGLAPQYQAHVFCDASSRAYAAAVYLRASTEQGTTSDVIFAKSRIAPMKELTIPQLELMATLLGVRTINFVTEQLKLPLQQRFLWTDSMCVLGWLQSDKVVGVFVDNRLREIRSSPDIAFGHVRTEENPADIPSRGVDLIDLKASQLWWKGPKWLVQGEAAWPLQPSTYVPKLPPEPAELVHRLQADETERRKNTEIVDSLWDLKRFSSLTQLLRSTSYVFRAVNRMRHKQRPASELLLAHEITHARCFWEKRVQEEGFPVSDDKSWKNNVRQMGLFRDDAGFWRCGGRYANTSLLSEAQNPKLLPTNHHFTTLTIKRCHAAAMHSGVKGTLAIIRQTYWISQGRRAVKSVISKCQLCRKHFGGPFARPEEPPLPDFRGKLTRPFAAVGIDYLGPLTVRVEKDNRKVWVALFTCAAVRAVHLELVDSLTASDFLLSLRRFMALYGKPDLIVSDNAKHFVTSNQVFDKLWQEIQESPTVVDFAATREISWKFITEKAPWFGGFYERLVKSVKHALKASLGSWTLTPDEFRTLLYEVAFVLNGRPLTYADDDPGDVVLTPAHLLFRARDMFPETTGEVDPVRQRSMAGMMVMHWRAGQNLLREFWDIWRKDYLLALRETWRTRKERGVSDIAVDVGAVVLIKEPLPRGMWRVGRITKVRPSSDGKVRTAEVRLPTGSTLARPVTLLYPIEAAGPHDEATVPGEPSAALAAQPMDSVAPSSRPVRKAALAARGKMREGSA